MTTPVTIVVPCYNYGHYLAESLESVRTQTFDCWECVVVDDGSTDNTEEVAKRFAEEDSRFVYVFQDNKGLSAARNKGITVSRGDYIQLLDADDLLQRRKLELQSRYLDDHPETDIVYGETRYFSSEKPEILWGTVDMNRDKGLKLISGRGKPVLKALLETNIMAVCAPLSRKCVFTSCGMFDETLKNHEDWEMWLRCAMQGKTFSFLRAAHTRALIRWHPESMSRNRIPMLETNRRIRKRLADSLSDSDLQRTNRKHYRRFGFELMKERCLGKGRLRGLIRSIKRALSPR